jgi:diguanylate cyclase (GGDEF)-like protein
MIVGLYLIAMFLLYSYSTLNLVDIVMVTLIALLGLVGIHISIMTSLVMTFVITLLYGLVIIFSGTLSDYEPVTMNYFYLFIPMTVSVLSGMVGLINQRYLRVSEDFSDSYNELIRIDAVTGFRNEKDYYVSLKEETERSKRYTQPLSLLLIHIESFDDLNHLYGISQGEKFLKHLSDFIVEITRLSDQHYRIKHDLFAIILPNTDFDGTALLKERFIKEFESLNIIVKTSHQKVTIEIDIVFEAYDEEMTADDFQHQLLNKLEVEPRGDHEKNN